MKYEAIMNPLLKLPTTLTVSGLHGSQYGDAYHAIDIIPDRSIALVIVAGFLYHLLLILW